MNSDEIEEAFPALKNIPKHYEGLLNTDCGIVKAKKSLKAVQKLCQQKYGTELLFKTKVTKVDKHSVTTEDGQTFTAKNVVVAAGAYSAEMFDKNTSARRVEVEYYVFQDTSGLPNGFIEMADNGVEYYGVLDGSNFDQYKIGENVTRNFKTILEYIKMRMPDKLDSMMYSHP